jgi:hypothetical protein
MQEQRLDGHGARPVSIDMCVPCQSLWFDSRESISLTPGSTLTLFRLIGEHTGRPQPTEAELAKCPRCRARLRLTRDIQRNTRFAYLNCPNGHGRLTTFFEFLKEKDFIKPLTPKQIADLRATVQSVNCSNCGAPVDLAAGSSCRHCESPLSMLDMKQAGLLVEQLRRADRSRDGVDPTLPLQLERARREVDIAFRGLEESVWLNDVGPGGLVGAGLQALARWLRNQR